MRGFFEYFAIKLYINFSSLEDLGFFEKKSEQFINFLSLFVLRNHGEESLSVVVFLWTSRYQIVYLRLKLIPPFPVETPLTFERFKLSGLCYFKTLTYLDQFNKANIDRNFPRKNPNLKWKILK